MSNSSSKTPAQPKSRSQKRDRESTASSYGTPEKAPKNKPKTEPTKKHRSSSSSRSIESTPKKPSDVINATQQKKLAELGRSIRISSPNDEKSEENTIGCADVSHFWAESKWWLKDPRVTEDLKQEFSATVNGFIKKIKCQGHALNKADDHRVAVQVLEKENKKLKTENKKLKSDNKNLKSENKELKSTNESNNNNNNNNSSNNCKNHEKIENLEATVADLLDKNKNLAGITTKMEEEFNELVLENREYRLENEKLLKNEGILTVKNEKLKSKNEKLKDKGQEKKIKKLKEERFENLELIVDLQKYADELLWRVEDAKEEIFDLEDDLEDLDDRRKKDKIKFLTTLLEKEKEIKELKGTKNEKKDMIGGEKKKKKKSKK